MAQAEVIFDQAVRVKVEDLKGYEKNPRRGNVTAIAESLKENGQFRPIVVRQGTNEILAGNHTWKGALQLGWDELSVVYVDVDDEQAARIVLADNRTNDLAGYDTEVLAEVMEIIEEGGRGAVGTGYSDSDMKMILQAIEKGNEDTDLRPLLHPPTFDDQMGSTREFGEDDNSMSGEVPETSAKVKDPNDVDLNKMSEETKGIFELKDDMDLPSSNWWGIPDLRTDMFIEKLPEPIDTWAGSATKDDDRDVWWFYNFGIDSTSGMKDLSKIILAFYCWDQYFENWWHFPSRHVTKALNAGIKYAVGPNFSQWSDDPKALNLWSLFRSRWITRYMQEAGIRVMPDICWHENDKTWLQQFILDTLPAHVPIICMQLQTFQANKATPEERASLKEDLELIVKGTTPNQIVVYSGEQSADFIEECNLGPELLLLPNRLAKLTVRAKKSKADKEAEADPLAVVV